MAATFIVTNTASLKRVLSLPRKSRISITTPRIARSDRSKVQEQANRLLAESGYSACAAGVVAVLLVCISWNGAYWDFFTGHLVQMSGLSLLACFFAGGLGRTTGLLYARWKLARLIWLTAAQMDGYWEDTQSAEPQQTTMLGTTEMGFQ